LAGKALTVSSQLMDVLILFVLNFSPIASKKTYFPVPMRRAAVEDNLISVATF